MLDGYFFAQTIKSLKKIIRHEKKKYRYDEDKEHLYNISYIENCIITIEDINKSRVKTKIWG